MAHEHEFNIIKNLPFGPPPILPDTKAEITEFLTRPDKLPIHNNRHEFKFWNRKANLRSLYYAEIGPVSTTLKVNRDPTTGKLIGFREVPVYDLDNTAQNSYSFQRAPSKATEDVLGKHSNYPFWPGGFEDHIRVLDNENSECTIDFENDLLVVPPGFTNGIDFSSCGVENGDSKCDGDDILEMNKILPNRGIWLSTPKETTSEDYQQQQEPKKSSKSDFDIESLLKELNMPVLRIKCNVNANETSAKKTVTKWAEALDTTKRVVDFEEKLMVKKKWPFELDTFQKLAILKLINHEHVLVSAHTSAGKTVVAEYAIELSFMHHSKVIYTSPIKALSNQKFRDFKKEFNNNVGLITGDFQINQNATCLVMTTEILRNMLFKGSDVIRELEYVIFDEIHYINDSERGHVWEEVLIMMPDRVCIIMLSATVPNALEFADWIGEIKKKKVYVVSTYTRPVPLQHHLFTGVEGKGSNLFLIRDGDGPFNIEGYNKAVEQMKSKKEIEAEIAKRAGIDKQQKILPPKPQFRPHQMSSKDQKRYLNCLLNVLEKSDLLPALIFTLSRRKCDSLADILGTSKELTTAKEKHFIYQLFHKYIKNLIEEDRKLPQVKWMAQLLQNGIGVHHSGILPILKEIVEMLFQSTYTDKKTGVVKTYIKVLFATETMAMGVNMPARTVVFDSITKHDGIARRDLLPAEYIQMAGRAGRRNLDSRGIVIITCQMNEVPNLHSLKQILLGIPTKLESQFRLTYAMILNMLKLEHMCIEDILSHSFKEIGSRKKLNDYRKQLRELQADINQKPPNIEHEQLQKMVEFYNSSNVFIRHWQEISHLILNTPLAQKCLQPGRIILLTHKNHIKKLALILQSMSRGTEYKVLVLCNKMEEDYDEKNDLLYQMMAIFQNDVFVPDEDYNLKHSVMVIGCSSIMEVTGHNLKIDINLIVKDWEQRQIPRFRDNGPNQTSRIAIKELYERSVAVKSSELALQAMPLTEFKINQLDLHTHLSSLLREKALAYNTACDVSDIPNFQHQFLEVFQMKTKEATKNNLEYLLSYKSLKTYPEYINKVKVLQELKYIDSEHKNTTKGNAACNVNNNELIITELIFDNKLSEYDPAEIAALLSCLVFTGKTECKPELSINLKKGKSVIKEIWRKINYFEQMYGVDSNPEPKFELTEVVYKWASGKPFAEIMDLISDVQEGIIVRCILQLHDILRDIKFVVGTYAADTVLKEKIEEASEKIKRDIVFTPSLYTTE